MRLTNSTFNDNIKYKWMFEKHLTSKKNKKSKILNAKTYHIMSNVSNIGPSSVRNKKKSLTYFISIYFLYIHLTIHHCKVGKQGWLSCHKRHHQNEVVLGLILHYESCQCRTYTQVYGIPALQQIKKSLSTKE